MLRDWDKRYLGALKPCSARCRTWCLRTLSDVNLFDFKGITHGSEVVDGGDLAFDREDIPCSPQAGSRKKDARLDELRLNVVEVK